MPNNKKAADQILLNLVVNNKNKNLMCMTNIMLLLIVYDI